MEEVLSKVKKVHLIGVGGIGMSGLAFLLKEKNFSVSGSDIKNSDNLRMCRDAGINVSIGHRLENIENTDLVCFSSAIPEDNIELREARKRKILTMRRAKLLALISHDRKTVAVTGSHGKTTTTSLLGFALSSLGYRPAVFVGGIPLDFRKHAWWGKNYFVIEADESDASFLCYTPQVSIITNIDHEHLDYHRNIGSLKKSFLAFSRKTKELVIGWGDDEKLKDILEKVPSLSYGFSQSNRVRAENRSFIRGFTEFSLVVDKARIKVQIPLIGGHNVLNSLAVFSFFYYLGEDLKKVADVLKDFRGTQRRWELKEKAGGVTFIDDYAHHPTEITAVLKAARSLRPKRVVVIFEPHRFSRIKSLSGEFSRCFQLVDQLILTDIYSASEAKIKGIDEEFLFSQIKKNFQGKLRYVPKEGLSRAVPFLLERGDLVLGLGAGEINLLIEEIIDEFKKARGKQQR